jgi:hypothetical protein
MFYRNFFVYLTLQIYFFGFFKIGILGVTRYTEVKAVVSDHLPQLSQKIIRNPSQ